MTPAAPAQLRHYRTERHFACTGLSRGAGFDANKLEQRSANSKQEKQDGNER
jgi:hypothetical protein